MRTNRLMDLTADGRVAVGLGLSFNAPDLVEFGGLLGFFESDAFGAPHLMVKRREFAKVVRSAVIEDLDAVEIRSGLGRKFPHFLLIADDRDLCDAALSANSRGLDRADVFALGQYNMLWIGGGSLTDFLQYHTFDL